MWASHSFRCMTLRVREERFYPGIPSKRNGLSCWEETLTVITVLKSNCEFWWDSYCTTWWVKPGDKSFFVTIHVLEGFGEVPSVKEIWMKTEIYEGLGVRNSYMSENSSQLWRVGHGQVKECRRQHWAQAVRCMAEVTRRQWLGADAIRVWEPEVWDQSVDQPLEPPAFQESQCCREQELT